MRCTAAAEVGPGEVEVRAALQPLPRDLQPLLQGLHLARALRERARGEKHLQGLRRGRGRVRGRVGG